MMNNQDNTPNEPTNTPEEPDTPTSSTTPSPRAYTTAETRRMYLEHVWAMVDFWDQDAPKTHTTRERLQGLAFSILVLLDGGTELPGCLVVPCPHPSDQAHQIERGERYFQHPDEDGINLADFDIAGGLHELFYSAGDGLRLYHLQKKLTEPNESREQGEPT
jgi:hypothetical protein